MRRRATRDAMGLFVMGALVASCGDPFAYVAPSTTSATTGGGGSGGATSTESGGAGGGGQASSCAEGVIGSCGEGKYCAASTGSCEACADLARLHFGTPSPIAMTPATAGTTAYYPRVSGDDETLYFVYIDEGGPLPRSRVARASFQPDKGASGAWSFMAPPIASPTEESAPIPLHDGSVLHGLVDPTSVDTARPVLLFDSTRNGATTRKVLAANLDGTAASIVSLPSGKRDFDIAVASHASPPRFYWMSDGLTGMEPRLVTATADDAQMIPVKITMSTGCVVDAVEGPWVSPDGRLLLFGLNAPLAGTCAPAVPGNKRLFAARMTEEGKQADGDQAKPLFPDDTLSFDTTPSLSGDACFMLFSRFDPVSNDGRPMLAARD
jgi:hypothetical protein